MATLFSYLYTERWQDWTLVYKALQCSRTNNLRTSNVLSFSCSLPRFQEPNHGTSVSFMLSCDEDMLSLGTLTMSILSKQLLLVQEISTAYILPELLLHHLLWYTLSLFFLEEWKVKYTYVIFFPQTKIIANVCRYTSVPKHLLFWSLILCFPVLYILYSKSRDNDGAHLKGKPGILWSKCFPCN